MNTRNQPFFKTTKRSEPELWETFASDDRGADYVDGKIVEIQTRADAEELLSDLEALPDHKRNVLLIQILRQEALLTEAAARAGLDLSGWLRFVALREAGGDR